ncbi:MAG: threonine/serine dehydratase [Pseudomonadota bacterium]
MPDIDDIRAAAGRIRGHARVTPFLNNPLLDERIGKRIYVKAECLQRTGSFKFRGAWSAISNLEPESRKQGVIAFSSGNHAQGIAHAATLHGIPSVIVMPKDAPQIKIRNTRNLGAEVVLYDRDDESREAFAEEIMKTRPLTLIKPFDTADVLVGQGTTGLEIAAQAKEVGIDEADVNVCCGGGGLTAGIALALEADAPKMTVRPAEPEGFDDVSRSQQLGSIQRNNRATGSIQDAILTPAVGDLPWPVIRRLCGDGHVISDDETLHAMALAFHYLKIVVEPGGATGLAASLFRPTEADTIIAVATGGNVDRHIFRQALDTLDT